MDNKQLAEDIYRQIVEYADAGESFALAQILKADGSTPQQVGVKAIIDPTGHIRGTLGGGLVEAESQRRAADVCKSGRPIVFDYRLDDAYSRDAGAICGGSMRVLIDPNIATYRNCYARASDALRHGRRGILLTSIESLETPRVSVQWYEDSQIPSEMRFPGSEEIGSLIARETPRLFVQPSEEEGSLLEVLAEPVIPQPTLLIVGGGHVGHALAIQAHWLGFKTTVIDDRPEFTDPARYPEGVKTCCGDIIETLTACEMTPQTYIALVTRGHKLDAESLETCIHAKVAYVGMIGSRRKVALVRKNFLESGLTTKEEFDRIFAPIGFEIGAVTVPEIATSIAAQLIAVRRRVKTPDRTAREMPR